MNQLDSFHDTSPLTTESTGTSPALGLARSGRPDATRTRRKISALAKNFILDTNVLLHDPSCIHRFQDNHVWVPVDVLSELDRFKNEQTERGANARAVHRTLTGIFAQPEASVIDGVPTEGGGTLRLAVFDVSAKRKKTGPLAHFHRIFPDTDRIDHRILATVLLVRETGTGAAILVTKDLNLQLKAMAVGVPCQDYLNDKVPAADVATAIAELEVDPHELQRFASSSELALPEARVRGFVTNDYVLLRAGDRKTIPARLYADRVLRRLRLPNSLHIPRGIDLRPANLGQQCFVDAMLDPEISLVTCFGHAGTGKTLLAVAAGLHQVFAKDYNGITVSRPVVAMGETLGFLPGNLEEKMHPWLQPIYDAFEVLMPSGGPEANGKRGKKQPAKAEGPANNGARKPYESMIDQGVVEIEALCYIRGRSIPRRFFVLDEAQQLTPREAKTIVTRMSKGSKLVMVGDPSQIDNPYVDSRSNGLVFVRNRMKGQSVTAHASLSKGERSDLAELGAELL